MIYGGADLISITINSHTSFTSILPLSGVGGGACLSTKDFVTAEKKELSYSSNIIIYDVLTVIPP